MTGYNLVKLEDMITELGEDRVKTILLSFSSPNNKDVEHFLTIKLSSLQNSVYQSHIYYLRLTRKNRH